MVNDAVRLHNVAQRPQQRPKMAAFRKSQLSAQRNLRTLPIERRELCTEHAGKVWPMVQGKAPFNSMGVEF